MVLMEILLAPILERARVGATVGSRFWPVINPPARCTNRRSLAEFGRIALPPAGIMRSRSASACSSLSPRSFANAATVVRLRSS